MDYEDWAAGTWYSEMAHLGRQMYEHWRVSGDHADVIERVLLGMEARALGLLDEDDKSAAGAFPPRGLVVECCRTGKHPQRRALKPPLTREDVQSRSPEDAATAPAPLAHDEPAPTSPDAQGLEPPTK